MPVVVVIFTTVGTLLGVLICTTNTALCPSVALALAIVNIGKPVLSMIVPVADRFVLVVFVLVTFPVKVNVSVPSLITSPNVVTGMVTLVAPAGIVIVMLDKPVKSPGANALPLFVLITMVVGTLLGLLNVTTKFASVPSVAVALAIVTVGIGVASIITPVVLAVVLPVLPEVTVAVNTNVSVPSLILSVSVGTFTVTLVAPAGMVTVVFTVVKSLAPAVPVVVVIVNTVGTLLGVLICTTNTALLPSVAGVVVTDTIGSGVASTTVPIAVADAV